VRRAAGGKVPQTERLPGEQGIGGEKNPGGKRKPWSPGKQPVRRETKTDRKSPEMRRGGGTGASHKKRGGVAIGHKKGSFTINGLRIDKMKGEKQKNLSEGGRNSKGKGGIVEKRGGLLKKSFRGQK